MNDDLVYRLRKRAEIRRQIPSRKSVLEGAPDRIADLLEEAADALEQQGTMTDIPEHWRTGELPMLKQFELEDKIMSAWSTKEDLELFMRQYLDCEKVMSEDEVSNVILGIISIHDLRCNELFETYTKVFKLDKYRE